MANPATNSESNESFDALIELLASDNVAEDPRFNHPSTGLRDDEGNLDLGKIHSFFAAGRDADHASDNHESPEKQSVEAHVSLPAEHQNPASVSLF